MTQILPEYNNLPCAYIIPDEEEVELEEGYIELEEDESEDEEGIEWLWEEEIETEVDGPIGPIIIKKGRYTETD